MVQLHSPDEQHFSRVSIWRPCPRNMEARAACLLGTHKSVLWKCGPCRSAATRWNISHRHFRQRYASDETSNAFYTILSMNYYFGIHANVELSSCITDPSRHWERCSRPAWHNICASQQHQCSNHIYGFSLHFMQYRLSYRPQNNNCATIQASFGTGCKRCKNMTTLLKEC